MKQPKAGQKMSWVSLFSTLTVKYLEQVQRRAVRQMIKKGGKASQVFDFFILNMPTFGGGKISLTQIDAQLS